MKGFSAARFFRRVIAVLTVCGIALAALAFALSREPAPMSSTLRLVLGATGALALAVALVGPLRIGLAGPLLPAEIKRAMAVNGACLAAFALALALAALHGGSHALSAAVGVSAAAALGAAWLGVFPASTRLPESFSVGELIGIARSAGVLGAANESIADRELRRWSTGREGVPTGAQAPDGDVVTLEGEVTRLSSLLGPGDDPSPLVLAFGSYTCPHFRKRVEELHDLVDKWTPRGVRFLTVYINEAHPEDGWRLEGQYAGDAEYTAAAENFCFFRAHDLDERLRMARWLVDKKQLRTRVVVDAMDDALMRAYNAWPIRLYVLEHSRVAFTGEQGPFGYLPAAVDAALEEISSQGRARSARRA
jgi:hypothetical protein